MANTGLIPHIIKEIADAENVEPFELPPLNEVIDPDTITAFSATDTLHDPDPVVAFTYYGYHIAVHGPDEITNAR